MDLIKNILKFPFAVIAGLYKDLFTLPSSPIKYDWDSKVTAWISGFTLVVAIYFAISGSFVQGILVLFLSIAFEIIALLRKAIAILYTNFHMLSELTDMEVYDEEEENQETETGVK